MQSQKFSKALMIPILLTLIWGLIACSGGSENSSPTGEANTGETPAEATVAIEASPEAPAKSEEGEAAAAEPAESKSVEVSELREPATLAEAAQAIDLRELPTLDATTQMGQTGVGYLSYQTSQKIPAVLDFYRPKLVELGWEEISEQAYVEETTAQLHFAKGDFRLYLGASQMGDNQVMVTMINHGNVDVRALPVYPDAEILYADSSTSSHYVTPAKVAEVVEFARKELSALGWHEYVRPNTSHSDDPNSKALTFIKNGLELTAYIVVAPAQGGKTANQYSIKVLNNELPLLDEASQVEFDENQAYLSYLTPADTQTVADFYRQKLVGMGYEELEETNLEGDAWLFASQEMPLLLTLSNTDGQTQVVLHSLEADELTALMGPAEEDTGEVIAETEPDVSELSEGQISAFSIPTPADASLVNYEPDLEEIAITSPSDIKSLVEFYREALPALGWQENSDFAIVEENIGLLTFEQGDASLDMNFFNDGFSGETELTVSASGLAWSDTGVSTLETDTPEVESDTPVETGSSYTINDWPIPEEAQEVDIDDEEISYVIDWDFETVTEFYRPIYQAWELSEGCLEPEEGFSSYSCSTGGSNVSVSMNLFENFDEQTEVSFFFSDLAPAEPGSAGDTTGDVLSLDEEEGLPVPSDFDRMGSSSSDFRQEVSGNSSSGVQALVDLYRTELPAQGWSEQSAAAQVETQKASLTFENSDGQLRIDLAEADGETQVSVLHKLTAAAKEMGILPPTGQGRVYLGNMHTEAVAVTLDGKTIQVAPTDPEAQPGDMDTLDLKPGEYNYTLAIPGEAEVQETLTVGPDEVWMMAILPGGAFTIQAY